MPVGQALTCSFDVSKCLNPSDEVELGIDLNLCCPGPGARFPDSNFTDNVLRGHVLWRQAERALKDTISVL